MATEPKTRRGQASRERIIATAAALMFVRGVRATSLDDVLAAARGVHLKIVDYADACDRGRMAA